MKNNETTKEMIIRKLTSRKLWVALISFVSAIMMYFNCAESEVAQVSTIIMAFGTMISYIVAEGFADGNSTDSNIFENDDEQE
ncbi:MAG: hypothetical protein PUK71_02140 [Blautia obeum]|nr:hypothetical protein [Blautia obeum]